MRRYWFDWVLGVLHRYEGTLTEAQFVVLDYIEQKLQDVKNPT